MKTVLQNILRRSQKSLISLLFGSLSSHNVYNFNKNVLIKAKVIGTVICYLSPKFPLLIPL